MSAGMGIIQEYPTQTSGIPLGAPFPIPPHPGAPQAPAWMWNSTKKMEFRAALFPSAEEKQDLETG